MPPHYKYIVIPSGDSKLGPKRLSLLEFETWRLRPIGHHGWFFKTIFVELGGGVGDVLV